MSAAELRSTVSLFARAAADNAAAWMNVYGTDAKSMTEGDLRAMVGVHADAAALVTADWYDQQHPKSPYSARWDDDLAEGKVAAVSQWVFSGPQTPASRIGMAAHRLVFDAARRTVQVNVLAEGIAMARHEEPGCCNKCIARATTHVKAHTDRSDDVDQFFHPLCEGLLVPVRHGVYEPPDHTIGWHLRKQEARRAGNVEPDDIANFLSAH